MPSKTKPTTPLPRRAKNVTNPYTSLLRSEFAARAQRETSPSLSKRGREGGRGRGAYATPTKILQPILTEKPLEQTHPTQLPLLWQQ
jgi:hypothetical protein